MRNVLVVLAMIAISSTASAQAVPAGTTFYYQ
jgi:hypothetical protein